MNDDSMNLDRRSYQCNYDLEERSSRQAAGFAAPYSCAVCGAQAESINNLCAPEFNPGANGEYHGAPED